MYCVLGNLDARRDWGYAPDYVEGMRMMLQCEQPGTFVLATNESRTVRDFVNLAFETAGIELEWRGQHEDECARSRVDGAVLVRVDPRLYRPSEVETLIGNPEKARSILGWEPSTTVGRLCALMVEADIRMADVGSCIGERVEK